MRDSLTMHFLNKKLFDMFNFLISLAYIFPIGWIMTRGNMLFANVIVYPASKPLCINYQQLQLTLPNWAKGYSFPSAKLRLQWNKTKPSSIVEFVNAIHVHGLTRLLPISLFVCLYPTPVSLGASVGRPLQYK